MIKREPLLTSILSQPTAPFRERNVIRTITAEFEKAGVPYFADPIGNIVVGVDSQKSYKKLLVTRSPSEPLRVFIAHMDHPGFHGLEWKSESDLLIKWHGGSPVHSLENAGVFVADSTGYLAEGKIVSAELRPNGLAIDKALVHLESPESLKSEYPDPEMLFGAFRFREPIWTEGDIYYTKAADDLVGSFTIASLALDLWSRGKKPKIPFLGLLTRAEEVGFIGAIGHLELGWLQKAKRPLLCVSLETSRTLPDAEIGKGPVVRLGDRFTVFDAKSLRVFLDVAEKALPGRFQRRVMDGGTCEGSAATVYGFPTVAISIPLGNYHNQSFEGGPDSLGPLGPAPEFVHRADVAGMIELCHALLKPKLPWNSPWEKKRGDFKKLFRGSRKLLKSGP
ncbi:MAG TPA: hypothetical protein VJB59_00805 [Bdellovibrionota bacterium]|nr:hypothetical protein [Bdellovibrionota bacterium]